MDNNQPYNEFDKQFNDLPLPGEEQAWQKMKQMLDEDEKKRKPLVPFFLKSCAGWGLGLLLVGVATWFYLKPGQNSSHPVETKETVPTENNDRHTTNKGEPETEQQQSTDPNPVTGEQTSQESTTAKKTSSQTETQQTITTPTTSAPGQQPVRLARVQSKKIKADPGTRVVHQTNSNTTLPGANKKPGETTKQSSITANDVQNPGTAVILTQPARTGTEPATDTKLTSTSHIPATDSAGVNKSAAPPTDSNLLKQPATTDSAAVVKKEGSQSKKSKFIVSAGIGLQQQIPMGGQESVPYDYYGRTGSLSDYIPSVYLRLEKENKWFVQGEFRYGAPQTLKDFQYSRQTIADPQNVTVTTYHLKKTYYHQFPFSFNYYIKPKFSVGVGGIYNRFYGAVTEKEVKQTNLQTQVETLSRQIVNIQQFNDSFLYKTQVHALLQAEYHWKRFDFGLRYTKDIQPYIKYTQPDGKIDVKKNQTFQLLVRYSIWQSRKKISG